MSDGVDYYYDVQGMIRDARSETRGEIDNAVNAMWERMDERLREDGLRDLRNELADALVNRGTLG